MESETMEPDPALVERVARAICSADPEMAYDYEGTSFNNGFDACEVTLQNMYRDMARAAIAEMTKPLPVLKFKDLQEGVREG